MPVVVDLPCVPATAMPWWSLISRPSIWLYLSISSPLRRAATSSGFAS